MLKIEIAGWIQNSSFENQNFIKLIYENFGGSSKISRNFFKNLEIKKIII